MRNFKDLNQEEQEEISKLSEDIKSWKEAIGGIGLEQIGGDRVLLFLILYELKRLNEGKKY